jgi:hypothetical protein
MRLNRAIRWISDRLQEESMASPGELISQASQEFGLTPRQEEFLYHLYSKAA